MLQQFGERGWHVGLVIDLTFTDRYYEPQVKRLHYWQQLFLEGVYFACCIVSMCMHLYRNSSSKEYST